ncbi:MAG: glycosyltransferase family 39 protein [Sulfuricellaceae bacterium]|nr:glycosyltransferase family 39 protein [Sulfuricellaceae bacterium]
MIQVSKTSSPGRFALLLLVLFSIAVWFSNIEYRHLVKPDEGRYAEIPREMVASGNWLTPRLNNIKYFEKPAMQYWATAAAYEFFGEHAWTSRLWTTLTGLLGIVLAYFTAARLFGREAGFYSALVLGSSLLYVLIGHINTLDMGVTFFMSLGLSGFLLGQREGATAKESARWMHIAWAALALAVLSKGLMGLVLPGAALVLYTLIQRDFALWKRLHLVTGTLLFLAIAAPWFIAVSLANPEFFHFFFIHEHFERFLTKVHGRFHPWWSFIPILLAGMLPWTTHMFDALANAWKSDNTDRRAFQPKRFLLIWAVFIFVFFSASDSKLPSYILPIFPALALLMGSRFAAVSGRRLFWLTLPLLPLAALALALAPKALSMASDEVPLALYQAYLPWIFAAAGLWLVGTLLALYFSRLGRKGAALTALALSGLIAGQLVLSGHESLSPASSAYRIAERIRPYLKPGIPFYSVDMYDQTLPFYIKRTVTLVKHLDEMEFGVQQEPGKWLPTIDRFVEAWNKAPYALAIMTPDTYNSLNKQSLSMQIIARDTRRIVVKKP